MAVAYDNDTQLLDQTPLTTVPITFSHTTSTSANRAFILWILTNGDSIATPTTWVVTYGGTSCPIIGTSGFAVTGANVSAWAFGCVAPATGANTVSATPTIVAGLTNVDLSAITFTGADQTGSTTTFNGYNAQAGDGVSATTTVSITSGSTSDLVSSATFSISSNHTSIGGGQTLRWEDNAGSTNTAGSTKTGAAGAVTMSHTWDGTGAANEHNVAGVNITTAGAAAFPDELQASRRSPVLSVP